MALIKLTVWMSIYTFWKCVVLFLLDVKSSKVNEKWIPLNVKLLRTSQQNSRDFKFSSVGNVVLC